MATNDKRIKLYNRKFTSISAMDTYFYDTLDRDIRDVLARAYPSGVISGAAISSSLDDTISVTATSAINYYGYIVDMIAQSNVSFENTAATIYHVGIKVIEVEAGDPVADAVEINSNTSNSEYVYWQEEIGEVDNPDSITITYIMRGKTE